MNVVWREADERTLIRLVKSRPILWDVAQVQYRRVDLKDQVWVWIAKQINKPGISAEAAKRKWLLLRDTFRRNLRKISSNNKMGGGEVFVPRWKWFEPMEFVRPSSMDAPQEQETMVEMSQTEDSEYYCPQDDEFSSGAMPELIEIKTEVADSPTSDSRESNFTLTDAHLTENPLTTEDRLTSTESFIAYGNNSARLKRPLPADSAPHEENRFKNPNGEVCKDLEIGQSSSMQQDESYHFGNFVASKLRQYDGKTRSAIQSAILDVFLRANENLSDLTSFRHCQSPPSSTS